MDIGYLMVLYRMELIRIEKLRLGIDCPEYRLRGGAGSGNFGHAGRPGQVGGSAPSGAKGVANGGKSGIIKAEIKTVSLSDETYRKTAKALDDQEIVGTLRKEFDTVDVSDYTFNDKHINGERKHNVTKADVQGYINDAKFSLIRRGGTSIVYVADHGAAYLNNEKKLIITAYSDTGERWEWKEALDVINHDKSANSL